MTEDFIECPYRFRIFLEIVNNLLDNLPGS